VVGWKKEQVVDVQSEEKSVSEQSIISQVVNTTGDLPTMPPIASLVMDKISDPNTTAKQLHQIIAKDQALAARVLRIANSPLYGCARTITRLTDAIMIMGFSSIKSLVLTSALHDFFKKFGLAEKLMWEHSIVAGSLSKQIARTVRFPRIEEAFLAGLMHDLGKVILNLKLPEKMLEIVQEVYNNPGITFRELEMATFGFDHAQVGQLVARKWNFAEEIEEAIGNHHQPEKATILPALSYIVNLANAFCHKLEVGPTKNPNLDLSQLPSARAMKLNQTKLDELMEEISQTLASDKGMLSL
jgi:putative nucleotidyltransferase with HDIG domain